MDLSPAQEILLLAVANGDITHDNRVGRYGGWYRNTRTGKLVDNPVLGFLLRRSLVRVDRDEKPGAVLLTTKGRQVVADMVQGR